MVRYRVLLAITALLSVGCGESGSIVASESSSTSSQNSAASSSTSAPIDDGAIKVSGAPLDNLEDSETDSAVGVAVPEIRGADYGGAAVVIGKGPQLVAVVAHWCPHCQREVPQLVEWVGAGALPEGVELVALSTSVSRNRPNYPPDRWLDKEQWPGKVLADDESATGAKALGAAGFPTFVAINRDGTVAGRAAGEISRAEFDALAAKIT